MNVFYFNLVAVLVSFVDSFIVELPIDVARSPFTPIMLRFKEFIGTTLKGKSADIYRFAMYYLLK